ncbi:MAG: 50S ribosomal protein L7ae [Candidatus Heimdallarchaeota archaeon]|nr:50S ribosomal protein L7ae [Candidatus Heimdallarchaeota archaeon]MCG3253203.1 50S ribosomal protein L7ae [Candidatus Heimdallarchaeota archaeon]MCK4290340.1 50S ribosomal protein L7Ae [Candidatus Heimdallarchaeota archaeon]
MSKPFYVNIDVPEELKQEALKVLEKARDTGKTKKGTNETTKAIERNQAKLVLIANDVQPQEIVMHLPLLCEEKNIPYVVCGSMKDIGKAIGLDRPSASAGITNPGNAKDALDSLVKKLVALKK